MRTLLSPTVALAAAACLAAGAAEMPRPRHGGAPSVLRVTNRNWLDVTVYVLHDGERSRLGLVTAATTRTFLLPRRLIGMDGRIRLDGEPVGSSERVSSETLDVQPGQRIEWTLESGLQRSSAGVMP